MSGKSLRLTFKGDKVCVCALMQPKRKRVKRETDAPVRAFHEDEESDAEMYGGDEQGRWCVRSDAAWVPVEACDELNGPAFIYKKTDGGSGVALSFNVPLSQVETSNVDAPELSGSVLEDGAMVVGADLAPINVNQVWVANKLPGLEQWTLKSAPGTFLASDKFGSVTATNEARGPHEEWVVKVVDVAFARPADAPLPSNVVLGPRRGIAFQSAHGKWLAYEPSASGDKKQSVRADADELDERCVWDASVQWKFRHAVRHAHRAARKTAKLDRGNVLDEERISRSRQGWNAGSRVRLASGDRAALERAQREGRLSEAMLDRRQRLKSDKYAWVRGVTDAVRMRLPT